MTIKNLYPTQRPALDLNFANSKRLDPRISFTRAFAGTYVGSDGLIKTAASGEARFDHDPVTGESLGLLVEESRTNLIPYSEDLVTGSWSANGTVSIVPNAGLSPSGTLTATRVGGTTSNWAIFKEYTVTPSTTYTLSFYAKRGTSTNINLRLRDQTAPANIIQRSFYSETSATEWTRVAETFTTPAGCVNLRVYPFVDCGIGDALIWGLQLEAGSFPTSYIPTSGSTVTRPPDIVELTNTNIYDTDSFTILNEPFGSAGGSDTLSLVGGGQTPVKRTTIYNQDLSQSQINTLVKKDDEFWRWRILGSSFALPQFATDGQVTVDWGDGTVETLTTSEHTFSDGGGYHDVGFRLDSGTYFRPYINGNASHDTKVVALGPAPESMTLHGERAFNGCSNLEAFDATVDATGSTNFTTAWYGCSSLTSFPLIDTSSGINFGYAWSGCSSLTNFSSIDTSSGTEFQAAWRDCSSLTSFPLIDTSSGTNFYLTWYGCSSLTSFPLIDTSSGTSFYLTWYGCSSLTSFPLIDTSSGTNFNSAWQSCTSLTSFPLIDTSSGTSFYQAWYNCTSLTSFPLIDTSSGTSFYKAWADCSSLTDFPANFFDSWTGTPNNNCFGLAWYNCSSLTATSVENILNSIDTSGQSAPASLVDIRIDYDTGTGHPYGASLVGGVLDPVPAAITNLKSRGWTIILNGVAQ